MEFNLGDKATFKASDDTEKTPMDNVEVTITNLDLLASLIEGEAVYVVGFEPVEFEGHTYADSTALGSELTLVEAAVEAVSV